MSSSKDHCEAFMREWLISAYELFWNDLDEEVEMKATFPPDEIFLAIAEEFPEKGKLDNLKML